MSLLKNRYFAISVLAAIVVMGISIFLPPKVNIAIIIIVIVAAAITAARGIYLKRTRRRHPKFARIYIYLTVSLLLTATLLTSSYRFFQKDIKTSYKYNGQNVSISGTVNRVVYSEPFGSKVEATIRELNGQKSNAKIIVEFETESPVSELDKFSLSGIASQIKDDDSYLTADGFSMKIAVTNIDSVSISGKSKAPWYTPFKKISNYICNILDESLSAESSALTKAMLMGDRSDLGYDTARDFRRIGISHMLALSGLHVSVILGGIDMIMRWFRMSRTKRSILLVICAFIYLGITGFSLSATRAVIMACMIYLSYIFSSEADSITSLFLSAFIIFAVFPSGLLDIGFWMSFFATLSLIIVAELLRPLKFKIKKKPWYVQLAVHTLSAVSTTIGAVVGTVAFSWLVFGELSIISVLTNIIFSFFTLAVLVLGSLMVIFHWIPFLSDGIAYILNFVVQLFTELASYISHLRGITVSLNYDFTKFIIIPLLAFTIIFSLIYLKRKWLIAMPTAAAITAFSICLLCYNIGHSNISTVSYIKSNNSELLTVVNTDGAAICDMSSGGLAHFETAYSEIIAKNATEIEKLILTHYHQYHPNTLKRICEMYMVREVYLPMPRSENDINWHNSIVSRLDGSGTTVKIYDPGDTINLGENCSIEISEYYYIKRSVHPMYYVKVTNADESFVYLSSSIYENESFTNIPDFDHIVFGTHGPNIHSAPPFSKYDLDASQSVILANKEKQWSEELSNEIKLIFAEDTYVYSTHLDGK